MPRRETTGWCSHRRRAGSCGRRRSTVTGTGRGIGSGCRICGCMTCGTMRRSARLRHWRRLGSRSRRSRPGWGIRPRGLRCAISMRHRGRICGSLRLSTGCANATVTWPAGRGGSRAASPRPRPRRKRGARQAGGHEDQGRDPRGSPPKTAAGIRDVGIPPHLLPHLAKYVASLPVAGRAGYLFPGRDGVTPMSEKALRYAYEQARKITQRDDLTLHDIDIARHRWQA
jgi:hypothetical protein